MEYINFKVIVAGPRDYNNYEIIKQNCDRLLVGKLPDVEIVSGKATGVDTLGIDYAKEKGLSWKEFPALWDDLTAKPCVVQKRKDGEEYNVLAGFIRNQTMADYADALIAFWLGKNGTRGTKDMIAKAKAGGLLVRIVRI